MIDWVEYFNNMGNNIDLMCTEFSNKIIEIYKRHIPSKEVTIRPDDKQWFNSELRSEIKKNMTDYATRR